MFIYFYINQLNGLSHSEHSTLSDNHSVVKLNLLRKVVLQMDQKDEILRRLTSNEYTKLIEVYKNQKSALATRGLNFLLTQKKILDIIEENGTEIFKSDRNLNTFYTHKNGCLKNGTFISISGTIDHSIFLCSLQETKEEMRECIFKTNLIKWKLGPYFLSVEEKDALHVLEFIKMNNLKLTYANWNVIELQSKETALETTYDVPEDVYLAPLKLEDSNVMDMEWPHQYKGSLEFIQDCVVFNGGVGVFSKDSNKLLCWVVKNENGSPGYV